MPVFANCAKEEVSHSSVYSNLATVFRQPRKDTRELTAIRTFGRSEDDDHSSSVTGAKNTTNFTHA